LASGGIDEGISESLKDWAGFPAMLVEYGHERNVDLPLRVFRRLPSAIRTSAPLWLYGVAPCFGELLCWQRLWEYPPDTGRSLITISLASSIFVVKDFFTGLCLLPNCAYRNLL